MRGVEFVRAEEVRRRPFRVSVAPVASLFMATRDAAGAQRAGTPDSWCEAIRRCLTRTDYETLAPLLTSQVVMLPDAVVPSPSVPGLTIDEEFERLVATSDAVLARDIHIAAASGPTGDWRAAERNPARWVRAYVGALARAWNGFEPMWRHAQESIAREVERVGIATARDAQVELMDGLLPNASIVDGQWRVDAVRDCELTFPDAGLVVVPLVAGRQAWMLGGGDTVVTDVSYPLRVHQPKPSPSSSPASLEALLGRQRARLLRSLQEPAANSRLAERLHTVPSVVTHHVTALEAAGLVTRVRAGRNVTVRRTPRGEALLALYQSASPGATSMVDDGVTM